MLLEHLHVDTVLFIVLKVIKTQLKGVQVTKGIYWLTVIEKMRDRCFGYGWMQGLSISG